jgi:hypothetical protein
MSGIRIVFRCVIDGMTEFSESSNRQLASSVRVHHECTQSRARCSQAMFAPHRNWRLTDNMLRFEPTLLCMEHAGSVCSFDPTSVKDYHYGFHHFPAFTCQGTETTTMHRGTLWPPSVAATLQTALQRLLTHLSPRQRC